MIKATKDGWLAVTPRGKQLGCYSTKQKAQRRLGAWKESAWHLRAYNDLRRCSRAAGPHQLSLDLYIAAYNGAWNTEFRKWLHEVEYDVKPTRSADEDIFRWIRREDAYEQRQRQRFQNISRAASQHAERACLQDGLPTWRRLRELVYLRDKGICWVCGEFVPTDYYHCGHVVDRVAGGVDRLDNLVVMCNGCNMVLKPVHDTREEAEAWRQQIGGHGYVAAWIGEADRMGLLQKALEGAVP